MPAPALLYLDTARLGQMSPLAQRLSTAFIRLSAEEPFSLYFERFMRSGFAGWPDSYQRRFPDLDAWGGIEAVKNEIRVVAGAGNETPLILASRSLWLVRIAARTAVRHCRRILTTDLSWPNYQNVVENEARRVGTAIVQVPLREGILSGRFNACEVIDFLATAFMQNCCDGLFLPAVDTFGVRLPIENIVKAIESKAELRFVLTDAAQALGHVPLDGVCRVSDFVVAGCHKWVRAYHPLGIGIVGRSRSAELLLDSFSAKLHDDPLFHFLECLNSEQLADHMETVNLTPLFSCQGALQQFCKRQIAELHQCQLQSAAEICDSARASGWQPARVDKTFNSGIKLLVPPVGMNTTHIEKTLFDHGIRATVYETGIIRLSIPECEIGVESQEILQQALCEQQSQKRLPACRDTVDPLTVRQPLGKQQWTLMFSNAFALLRGMHPIAAELPEPGNPSILP